MGYFKRLSDSSFKTDSHGNTIFYPWGIIGKGYVLPDKKTEDKIRKFVIWYHFTGLIVILVTGAFLGLWIVSLLFLPIAVLVWCVQSKRFIMGLPQSDEKLSYKENLKKMFGRDNS